MKTGVIPPVRAAFCALFGLSLAPCTTWADAPCDIEVSLVQVGSTFYRSGGQDWCTVQYEAHAFGIDACGLPVDQQWTNTASVMGSPTRSCTEPTTQAVRIEVLSQTWCAFCSDADTFACCELSDASRFLDVTLVWPPARVDAWRLHLQDGGNSDPQHPNCGDFQLMYLGAEGAGVRLQGQLLGDGIPLQTLDLVSDHATWDSQQVCLPSEPCMLLALPFDVVADCAGQLGPVTQGLLVGRAGDDAGCPAEWPAESRLVEGSRAVAVRRVDGTDEVTLSRAVPPGADAVRWTVLRQASGSINSLADGNQPGGSSISGSSTGDLTISGISSDDLGVYTMLVHPVGAPAGTEVGVDSMRLVASVGQPEFVIEPVGSTLSVGQGAFLFAQPQGANGMAWRINGLPLPTTNPTARGIDNGLVDIDGWLLSAWAGTDGSLAITPIWFSGGDPNLAITAEAYNDLGGVLSYEARIEQTSFHAYATLEQEAPPKIGVRTASQHGHNTYFLTIETSIDLGLTWQTTQISLQHTAPGEMYTSVPVPIEYPFAAIAVVRASVSDGFQEVGSLPSQGLMPSLARSTCGPETVNFTDFRCPTCPPVARLRLDGSTNENMTITRTLPAGNWQVRWAKLTFGLPYPSVVFLTDGPTGIGRSEISGSDTPALTIRNCSWNELGTYAMFVRNADDPAAPEFCADLTNVISDPCELRVLASPESQRTCDTPADFLISAVGDQPGATLEIVLDGRFSIFPQSEPSLWEFDDPYVEGDEVSFTIQALSPTEYQVTSYTAACNHTFGGTLSYDSTICGWYGTPVNTMVVWHLPAGSCTSCPSDLDGSGEVDNGDVALVLLDFGLCPGCPTDFDGSGEVDNGDLALVLLDFGLCP